ncbi:Phage gp6-like head-tail connector protein [compost metagenome]
MIELQLVKEYLRVDGNDEDRIIAGFIAAAEVYLNGAGIKSTEGELYKIVVYMLVALFYEHRDTVAEKVNIPPVILNFITQLAARSVIT